jgi:hypothetical protein
MCGTRNQRQKVGLNCLPQLGQVKINLLEIFSEVSHQLETASKKTYILSPLITRSAAPAQYLPLQKQTIATAKHKMDNTRLIQLINLIFILFTSSLCSI